MTMPNVSHFEAASTTWDVIVIGGGPAGAVATRQSALAGYRTLLVDKQAFPRTKVCGACVNARALNVLSMLGMEACIAKLPSVPLDTFALHCGRLQANLDLPGGRAIARSALDDALVREAIQAGASWLPQTTANVAALTDQASSRAVELTDVVSKRSQTTTARVVLVADGLGSSSLQRCDHEFSSSISQASRIGVGGIVCDSTEGYADKTIHMAVSRHGYVGLVVLADGSLNLAAAIDSTFLKKHGVSSAVGIVLSDSNMPFIDFGGTIWKGTPPLTRQLNRPASTRVLVMGDAAGYVEPFTGEGIAWAITAGAAAATLIPQGVLNWTANLEEQWLDLSNSLVQQQQFICRVLAKTLRSVRLTSAVTRLLSMFPALAAPIIERSGALPHRVERRLRVPVCKASPSLPRRETIVASAPHGDVPG